MFDTSRYGFHCSSGQPRLGLVPAVRPGPGHFGGFFKCGAFDVKIGSGRFAQTDVALELFVGQCGPGSP